MEENKEIELEKTENEMISEKADKNMKVRHASQIISRKGEHPKMTELLVMMLSGNTLPFYAEFSTFINYYETTSIPTLGVNINKNGMNMYWNRKFVDSLELSELMFILIHENFHLLFDHTKRSIFYNKEFSNIAQDMIINSILVEDVVKKVNNKHGKGVVVTIPKFKDEFIKNEDDEFVTDEDGNKIKHPYFNKNMGLFIPKEYPGEPIFENLYEWLKNEKDKYQKRKDEQGQGGQGQQDGQGKPQCQKDGQEQDGQGQKDGQGQQQGKGQPSGNEPRDSFGKPSYGKNGKDDVECESLDALFDRLEKGEQLTLDSHLEDDVQDDARKSIVNDFIQRLKNRGLISGDVEAILDKLRKSKKDYLKEIKRVASNHIMGSSKRKSITRPNRRGIEGIKGKKKFKNVINCVLDTSGSMCGDFDKVLSYIYQNDIHVNLIQIDTEVKAVENIKSKRDLQKMIIHGMGGTVLQPAIEYINDPKNKLHTFNTILLTDGYTDTLNFTNLKTKTLILTTGTKPNINDPRGNVKIIEIDLKESINS